MIPFRRRTALLQKRCQFVVLSDRIVASSIIIVSYSDTDIWFHRVRHRAEGQECPSGPKKPAPLPPGG